MSTSPLLAVTLAYLGVAVNYYRERRYGMAVVFLGYSLANLGIVWDMRR